MDKLTERKRLGNEKKMNTKVTSEAGAYPRAMTYFFFLLFDGMSSRQNNFKMKYQWVEKMYEERSN